jgi:hypothetical protein
VEVLFELLFEVFGEALLQVAFEALAEVGIHVTRGKVAHAESRSAWRLVLGYPMVGAIAGGPSLVVMSHSFAHTHAARVATLVLAPLAAASATTAIGVVRARRGQQLVSLDRFV